jgi:hypothetical protein
VPGSNLLARLGRKPKISLPKLLHSGASSDHSIFSAWKCISESEFMSVSVCQTSVRPGLVLVKFTSELLNHAAAAAGSRCSGCQAACTGT